MNFKNRPHLTRNCLVTGLALWGLSVSNAFGVTINYTTSVTTNQPGYTAGVPNEFSLPFTPATDWVNVTGSVPVNDAGSFVTNSPNPNVTPTNIEFAVDPTINGTDFGPIMFTAEITNPATNVYDLDFSCGASSTNCFSSNNPAFGAVALFDNDMYEIDMPTYIQINEPTKTTSLYFDFSPMCDNIVAPEPFSIGLTGLALCGLAALKFRRKRAIKN